MVDPCEAHRASTNEGRFHYRDAPPNGPDSGPGGSAVLPAEGFVPGVFASGEVHDEHVEDRQRKYADREVDHEFIDLPPDKATTKPISQG
jgi:hypothetical protein